LAKINTSALERYGLSSFNAAWGHVVRGIEKECLRVATDCSLSKNPHPEKLGSPLTNPFITTDFSEALLEFITPAYSNIDECLEMLDLIHCFSAQNIEQNETLWSTSMPCSLGLSSEIPIANYGNSNNGLLKTLYRKGLSNRYGSIMQTVAGIHYNFSMPESFWAPFQTQQGKKGSLQDFKTKSYLNLIRNFHRFSWLLIYLFGASPAADRTFLQSRQNTLETLDDGTVFLPFATCLRMGRLGYKSKAQQSLFICYNDLQSYVDCLKEAMKTPYPAYQEISQGSNGNHSQINANLLQLENEFYSSIRPKRTTTNDRRPLEALLQDGIEYIEIRSLDLNPYLPLGIDSEQCRFLDTFLLHCLLSDSPECNAEEFFEVAANVTKVVERGRSPGLNLMRQGTEKSLRMWSNELLNDMRYAASLLDNNGDENSYGLAVQEQQKKIDHPELTPSVKMMSQIQQSGQSFIEIAHQQSKTHTSYFLNKTIDTGKYEKMKVAAVTSISKQKQIEALAQPHFDDFLNQWNAHLEAP
jgi:glutamate--cysteine ligase